MVISIAHPSAHGGVRSAIGSRLLKKPQQNGYRYAVIPVRLLLFGCLLHTLSGWAFGQEASVTTPQPIRESVSLATNSSLMKQFEEARSHIVGDQWSDAIELLEQIAVSDGDSLVRVSPGRYVSAGIYANLLLTALPAEGRTVYRKKVDARARNWFTTARDERNEPGLHKIIERAFNSSYGDDALFLLADWAWERGELDIARSYWMQILPPSNEHLANRRPTVLQYPDTDLPLAEITAKLVLCSLAEGSRNRAAQELDAFTSLYPNAMGILAGRKGKLAEILGSIATEATHWRTTEVDMGVPTFALNAQRNAVLAEKIDVGGVKWQRRLPQLHLASTPKQPALGNPGSLSYHPVTFGELVLVNSTDSVFAWNLKTGKSAWPDADAEDDNGLIYPAVTAQQKMIPFGPVVGVPHYTMLIDSGRLFAKMGTPITETSDVDELRALPSDLICLDLARGEGKLLWKTSAKSYGPQWTFAGSPVIKNGRVYIVLEQSRPQTQLNVACFDADSGSLLWNRQVCAIISNVARRNSILNHRLLTLAGKTLFLSTDSGAIAAIDARNGLLNWVITYESRQSNLSDVANQGADNSLIPCLYHRGLVIVAPRDHQAVIAIDAATGLVVWERRLRGSVDHLLGVGQENLIVSGDRLWGLDVFNGQIRWTLGSSDPETFGYGRGLLAGNDVYWPKRDEIFVVDQLGGRMRRRIAISQLHGITGGNLTASEGMLLIAQPHRLVAFGQFSLLKKRLPKKISLNIR